MSINHRIKWKYLCTMLLIFTLIITWRIYYDTKHHSAMLQERVDDLSEDITRYFEQVIQHVQDKYFFIATIYMNSPAVVKNFNHDHRKQLYEALLNDYNRLRKQEPDLYVMHLFDTYNTTILRMHKPYSFGDTLSKLRPIVKRANFTQNAQYGFEVGKNGMVYRITTPFIHNGFHMGVLEFGIKPDYFVSKLHSMFDIKSEILVKTDRLSVLTVPTDITTMGEYSVISRDRLLDKLSPRIDLQKKRQILEMGDKTYIVFSNLNLNDFMGKEVAKIIVAKDITPFVQANTNSLYFVNTVTVSIFIFGTIILYLLFNSFVERIERSNKKIDKLHAKSNHFEDRANKDDLTGIFNKRYSNRKLKTFLKKGGRGALIFFDLDHFKQINDSQGHLVGDAILKNLASSVSSFLRKEDLFARWGGEEFVILLQDLDLETAVQKAEAMRSMIENSTLYQGVDVTVSCGVTMIEQGDDVHTLLERADKLLYKAKKQGRNCVVPG